MHDVVVIGGGVVGLSIAWESCRRGLSVVLVDQGRPGGEASWAGAGMLPPGHPGSPLSELSSVSTDLWPQWSADLREQTGIDNGYRRCGGLRIPVERDEEIDAEIALWQSAGIEAEVLRGAEIRECEPELSIQSIDAVCRLPGLAQVRNPRHLKALNSGCRRGGVDFRCGQPVLEFKEAHGRTCAAVTPTEEINGRQFVVACGAWSGRVLSGCCDSIRIEPVRGQIVLLDGDCPPIGHVLEQGRRYVVPRPDGRVLVGSTEERTGFEKANTAEAVSELIAFATSLLPVLGSSRFDRAWSGLRPQSVRGLPYLGAVPGRENLFVAAGHFRDGLKLSPATAVVMAELITGQRPSIAIDQFAPR